jgi:hypothetical protein
MLGRKKKSVKNRIAFVAGGCVCKNVFINESPGGMAEWSSRPSQDQELEGLNPAGYKI